MTSLTACKQKHVEGTATGHILILSPKHRLTSISNTVKHNRMATTVYGNSESYRNAWSRHKQQLEDDKRESNLETGWVIKRYIPNDLRSTAPVQRYKPLAPDVRTPTRPESYWIPKGQASLKSFSRDHEEKAIYASQPSTRCEEWSTLRQMLPSSGRPVRHRPPNWGTGLANPPDMVFPFQRRFPHINSPMTRYVDDMHLTNRLFKLH